MAMKYEFIQSGPAAVYIWKIETHIVAYCCRSILLQLKSKNFSANLLCGGYRPVSSSSQPTAQHFLYYVCTSVIKEVCADNNAVCVTSRCMYMLFYLISLEYRRNGWQISFEPIICVCTTRSFVALVGRKTRMC